MESNNRRRQELTKGLGIEMYLLYADEAGSTGTDYDHPQQPVFNLGGIIVPCEQWMDLNNRINAWKQTVFPAHPHMEIHAADIFSGKNDKKNGINYRLNSAGENLAILEKTVDLILSLSLTYTVFNVQKRNLKSCCQTHYGSGVKIDPYFIALPYVLSFFDSFLSKRKTQGIVFLDEQNTVYQKIDSVLDSFRLFTQGSKVMAADHIIERAMFVESRKSNFVQLADVCNFIVNRRNTMIYKKKKPDTEKDLFIFEMYNKIRPLILDEPFDPKVNTAELKFFDDYYQLMQ